MKLLTRLLNETTTTKNQKMMLKRNLLTGMNVGVFLHVGLLMKSFAAKFAWERPSVAMDQQMCG